MIIDADNAVLGRLASNAAKTLLKGEKVIIFNAEKAVITGNKKPIIEKYLALRRIGSPQHGPFFSKTPANFVRRVVRGMLPKNRRGRNALKKLRVYTGVPEEAKKRLGDKSSGLPARKAIKSNYVKVEDISKAMGWNK